MEELILNYEWFYHITSVENARRILMDGIQPNNPEPLNPEGLPIVCLTIEPHINGLMQSLGPAVFRISAETILQKQFGIDKTFLGWERAEQMGEVEGLQWMIERAGSLAVYNSFLPTEIERVR